MIKIKHDNGRIISVNYDDNPNFIADLQLQELPFADFKENDVNGKYIIIDNVVCLNENYVEPKFEIFPQ